MKKIAAISVAFTVLVSASACKKGWKDFVYSDVTASDHVQAIVKKKSGENVLWFEIFDQKDEKATVDSYKSAPAKVDEWPAKINEKKWIWMLVNDRIEIRLIADDRTPDFKNTDKLKDFIKTFDLKGMKNVEGPKLKGEELKKFMPTLGDK